jgi:molybdate transport system regulatory protein
LVQKRESLTPSFKVWLKKREQDVLGEGGTSLLEAIGSCGSITKAAREAGMSYKYAWDRLAEIQAAIGRPVVSTRRGRRTGGGGAELTPEAKMLLRDYWRLKDYVGRVVEDQEDWEAVGLKISARNRFKGTVRNVKKGPVTSTVRIEVQTPIVITAVITKEAVEELSIKPGDKVEAVIKATEVMIAKE